MKTFDLDIKPKHELQQKKQQQKEYKLIGTMRHRSGHILYAINRITLQIKEAEYIKKSVLTWEEALHIIQGGHVTRTVQTEKDFVYIEALNKENALKRFRKLYP